MFSIIKRELRSYIKNPLFWIGIVIVILGVFQNVSPYLQIHYLAEGEEIINDYPEIFHEGEVYEGYVPTKTEQKREMWEEQIKKTLISAFQMNAVEAENIIHEMKEMNITAACEYLEKNYNFYGAHYVYYEDINYHKGSREEINEYIADKLKKKSFSYYFSRKFADFAGLFMGFFATIILSVLFFQDTRKNTYELLHTKPISAGKYIIGKIGGGFAVCLFTLVILNLIFWILCSICTGNSGFEVRLIDFIAATCLYILPNMLMVVCVYSFISLVFKNPLPAMPFLLLYMVYSNMGSRNAEGIYGYYGRPLAIMVRFPGAFFDTAPPPMALLNQSFLLAVSFGIIFISIQLWKRRRVY